MIDIIWGISPWPDGTGEETSFEEWLNAGGRIIGLYIYLNGNTLLDDECRPIAVNLLSYQTIPTFLYQGLFDNTNEIYLLETGLRLLLTGTILPRPCWALLLNIMWKSVLVYAIMRTERFADWRMCHE